MTTVNRELLALALAIGAATVIAGNYRSAWRWLLKREHASLIPLLGGALGGAATALWPSKTITSGWWVPPVFYPGGLPLLVLTVLARMRGIGRRAMRRGP